MQPFHPTRYKSRSRGKNGAEYVVVCPFCLGDLHWNAHLGGGQCFRCHKTFNTIKMRFHFKETARSIIDELFATLTKPPRKVEQKQPPRYGYQQHWQARWHFEDYRKCDPKILNDLGVWYDEETDRICVPIQLVGGEQDVERPFMSRATDPDEKGWKAQPFGITKERHWFTAGRTEFTSPLVLVEGIFDVLTPRLDGTAIATLGTKLTPDMQDWFWLHEPESVVIWYDPDEPGIDASKIVKAQLEGVVKNIHVINDKPEPGDLTPEEVREILGCVSF